MKEAPEIKIPFLTYMRMLKQDPIALRTKIFSEYGDIAWRKALGIKNYYLAHPMHAKYILKDNPDNYFKKHPLMCVAFGSVIGDDSIFISPDKLDWERKRATLGISFDPRVYFQDYANAITQKTDDMFMQWQSHYKDNDFIDIGNEIDKLLVLIVLNTIITEVPPDAQQYVDLLTNVPKYVKVKITTPSLIWNLSSTKKKATEELAVIKKLAHDAVMNRLQNKNQYDDMLGCFMHEYKDLPQEKAMELFTNQLVTGIAVSFFTTSGLLNWLLVELSRQPEMERRIAAEVNQVIGDRLPTYDDMKSLHYLSCFIKETLRVHPPLFGMLRQASSSDVLDGFSIPKDSGIILSTYHIHRHPDFWNNPEGFDPERFLNNPLGQSEPFAYIPFGSGERKCIGTSFSTLEATLILAMIVQRCQLQLPANTDVKSHVATLISMRSTVKTMKLCYKK